MLSVRQKSIDPCKVAMYIRWSTDDQGEGTTLVVQLEGCRHYAMSQGWAVSDSLTFIDDGYSGGRLDRPALTRLREAIAQNQVDCVVVYKLDRLSRDVPDMIRLIMDEWDGLCFVKSAREPIDTTSQSGKIFFYTLASYAEWERSVIKDRTFSGKLRRAQEGRNPGIKPPFGYALGSTPGTFEIVPEEAVVVRRIYAMYRMGLGMVAITSTLNRDGARFRGGGLWNQSTVKHMLNNPAYKGELIYGRRLTDSKRNKRILSAQPHLTSRGLFSPIVSKEEWDLVQQIKQSRPGPANGKSGRSHSSIHLLTGMLRCQRCDLAFNTSRGTGAPSGDGYYRYYICTGYEHKGPLACDCRRIPEPLLDELVVRQLKELYGSEVARKSHAKRIERDMAREESAARTALTEVEASLQKIEGKRKKVRALVLEDALSAEDYRAFVKDVEDEARALEGRRSELQQCLASLAAAQSTTVGLLSTMARVDSWDTLTKPEQKELLRTFVARIDAYGPRGGSEVSLNITWKVPVDMPSQSITMRVTTGRSRALRMAVSDSEE